MEIIWYGHACFRIKDRNAIVVTDPYDKTLGLALPRPKADIVTVSHATPHHNYVDGVKGDFMLVNGPGEYEIKDVFITGINMAQAQKNIKDDQIPSKNNVDVLRTCVDSIICRTDYANYEILIVDNGSTDGTGDVIREHMAGFPVPLRMVVESTAGLSFARNRVVREAGGRAVVRGG